jgi:hypothetical protein
MEAESEVGTRCCAKGAQRKQHALSYFVASRIQLGGLLDWVRAQAIIYYFYLYIFLDF